MIKITYRAEQEIRKLIKKSNSNTIRIFEAGGGWRGPSFHLTLDKSQNDNDAIIQFDGFKVLINKKYYNDSMAISIDFLNSLWAKGFIFDIKGSLSKACC